MKIAYLTNVYPHVRHTFIRREILGLEAHGVPVARFSIRRSDAALADPADRAEQSLTRTALDAGAAGLLRALAEAALTRPLRLSRAAREAWRLGRGSHAGLPKHFVYLAEACLLRRWLADAGVTHLHVHFATNPAAVAMLTETLGGPPFSITIHGPEEWDRPEALSLTAKYERARFLTPVSHFGRCQVYRWVAHDHWGKAHVVRCGVDAGFLGEEPAPIPEEPRLALVGALTEQKGHLILLEALARLKAWGTPFEMTLVGDGHLRPLIESRLKQLGLTGRVAITGWVGGDGVREHLRRSRGLVMSSLAENLPVAMMEAMALGRPVVGTYVAGVPELVEHGVTGYLVPPGDAEGLAAAIRRLLELPAPEAAAMGRRARARVAERHDAGREAGRMAELFRRYARPVKP